MATLEEVIKQRLAEATQLVEAKAPVELKKADPEEVGGTDVVDTNPKKKKELTKEETTPEVGVGAPVVETKSVSSQVSALLEAEGLSEDFKTQAVTIFEAAVTDRVLQLEEGLKTEFDKQLAEAKAELDNDIDGFLSEAIQQWKQDNEVAIKSNFKSQLAESFMDGVRALIVEHNIEVPEDKEDALAVALSEVDKLNESIVANAATVQELQEQVNTMKSEQILESFKEKMTQTEFDRFVQLTESVKFKDEAQYAKQLTVVLENFGSSKAKEATSAPIIIEQITEGVQTIVTESNSDMSVYAQFISKQR
jgi:hypothetical protein